MTDGERQIWAAAFVRRLLDRATPTSHATASVEAYALWQREIALDAAGCASNVLDYARSARDVLARVGDTTSALALDLADMLGPPAPPENPSTDAPLPGSDKV